jgi:hypothetical protein
MAPPEQQAYDQQAFGQQMGAPGMPMDPQMEMRKRMQMGQQMMMGQQRGQPMMTPQMMANMAQARGGPMMGQPGFQYDQQAVQANPQQFLQQLMMSNQLYGQRGLKPQGRSPRGY